MQNVSKNPTENGPKIRKKKLGVCEHRARSGKKT